MRSNLIIALIALVGFAGAALAEDPAPAPTPRGGEMMRERLAQYDLNGDGGYDADEIAALRSALFQRLDADADGFISAQERAKASKPKIARFAARFGGAMDQADGSRLDALDVDGDGAISQEEFASYTPAWVERLDANLDGMVSSEELAAGRAAIAARRSAQ